MSAEIQTSLFILTAEIAAVTSVAALVAAGLAWARGRARLKAAEALRDAAQRLPGEGQVVKQERELLGEFARAYLTRDAEVLAGLPARLLSLRQAIEAAVPPEAEADPAQVQAIQSLEAERAALQAKVEGLERQQEQLRQQLDTALSTINTMVQEYGRGRGQEVSPTAEMLLKALMQLGGTGIAVAPTLAEAGRDEAQGERAEEEPMNDRALPDGDGLDHQGKPEDALEGRAHGAATDIDALLEDVLGAHAEETETEVTLGAGDTGDVVAMSPQAESLDDPVLDLSLPLEPSPVPAAQTQGMPVPLAAEKDELDALDIDALLDAELGRQARLLAPAEALGDEQYDLSRVDEPDTKK